jgi:hypothetical protein
MCNEDLGLDKDLVNQFVTCIGVYPIGSLVKLSNGKLAMVIRLNKEQPLSPVVMVFYDIKTREDKANRIDLSATDDEIISSIAMDDIEITMSQLLTKALTN